MGWKQRFGQLGAALAFGGALLVAPAAASASAAPAALAVAPAPAFESDGCTSVPDSGPFFNFYSSCYWHDWCYTYHPYGDGSAGRLACDQGFRDRMRQSCRDRYPRWWQLPARNECYKVADTYYWGVRAFGGSHF